MVFSTVDLYGDFHNKDLCHMIGIDLCLGNDREELILRDVWAVFG